MCASRSCDYSALTQLHAVRDSFLAQRLFLAQSKLVHHINRETCLLVLQFTVLLRFQTLGLKPVLLLPEAVSDSG